MQKGLCKLSKNFNMNIVSLFNNKGGVGKTTLAFHLSCALAEMGKRVLMIDMDPQCNLTLCCMNQEALQGIWEPENDFIDDFHNAKEKIGEKDFCKLLTKPRSVHFLLKPTEDGIDDLSLLPPLFHISENLELLPGRITINQYENRISERWSGLYMGDPLSIRTIVNIRSIAMQYANENNFDFVIIDTSPSLGMLNKVIISTVDGFLIPALPDMFSLYGIRNIGNSLRQWKKEFDTFYRLISEEKRSKFPDVFVRFLGYTIYNAKKYEGHPPYDLAIAHQNYVQEIPSVINQYISEEVRLHLSEEQVKEPIGGVSVMHTHNTFPSMSQKYHCAIWQVPSVNGLEEVDRHTIRGNKTKYEETKDKYIEFANSFLDRISTLKK